MALEDESKDLADAMEEMRRNGRLSAETLAKLSGSADSAKKGLEKFSGSLLGVGQAVGGLAGTIAKGEGSFASLGSTIEATTKIMGSMLSVLPVVGGAMKAMAEGVGEASKFVLDQLDMMAKNYQTLGDASAIAVDGIDGLQRQFDALGNYSLPAFAKAVKANMAGLTAFKGTAAEGAEELANVAGALTRGQTAREFLKLGISLDQVGDSAAQFSSIFGRMGTIQGNTTDELAKKTRAYILEVDQIARLTGQSREAQQKAQQQTLADARARAILGELAASGQEKQADQLQILMSSFDESTNAIIRASATGIPLTENAQKASVYTQNAIIETVNAVKNGTISAVEGTAQIRKSLAQGADTFRGITKFAGDTFGGITVAGEDAAATLRAVAELRKQQQYAGMSDAELVKVAQKKQLEASGDATEGFVDAQEKVADTNKKIQQLGFSLSKAAIPAVDAFANKLNDVVDWVNDKLGVGGKVPRGTTGTGRTTGTGGTTGTGKAPGVVSGKSVTIGEETRTGGDRNWRNNNPGNIEYGQFAISMGAIGSDGRFAIFPTLDMGRKAADTLLKGKSYANLSAAAALKKWAPESENNVQAYAANMVQQGVDLNKRYVDMTPQEQAKFLDAMTKVEGGRAGTVTASNGKSPTIAGPLNSYESQVAKVKPVEKVKGTTEQSNQNRLASDWDNNNKIQVDLLERIATHLSDMSYQNQKIAENTNKTAKNTA